MRFADIWLDGATEVLGRVQRRLYWTGLDLMALEIKVYREVPAVLDRIGP